MPSPAWLRPSVQFYLEDQQLCHALENSLAFSGAGGATVEVIDQISQGKRTIDYRYHHGHWDGAEREFRGFGRVDQRDTETFEDFHATFGTAASISLLQRAVRTAGGNQTWFYQGPVGESSATGRNSISPMSTGQAIQRLSRPAGQTAQLKLCLAASGAMPCEHCEGPYFVPSLCAGRHRPRGTALYGDGDAARRSPRVGAG